MRTVAILIAGLVLTGAPLTSQAAPVAPVPPSPEGLVNTRLLVDDEWLAGRLHDPRVVVLHVGRTETTYRTGHIPGARFLPLEAILVEREAQRTELPAIDELREVFEWVGVGDRSHVVLYGDLDGLAAARAFFTLDYLGHPRVSILDGGLERWSRTGRPVATEPTIVVRGSFTPRPRTERVVTMDWLRHALGSPSISLVDARPPNEFSGVEAGSGVGRPGHIPGARGLFWRRTLRGEEDSRLRDPEALRRLFRAANVAPGRTLVAYCRTGLQASHTYFVARYLGYDVALYDGSFVEWSRDEDLPVAR